MTVIVCIDDRGGMLFNRRRLSRDRVLTADAVAFAQAEGKRLSICGFSEKLFEEHTDCVTVDENFLEKNDAVCFVENKALSPLVDRIDRLVLYRWNRTYPFDTALDIDPEKAPWKLLSREEFAGYSHEKITKEIYVK